MSYQVGVLPVTKEGKVVLIRNRSNTYWLFPKGCIKEGKEDIEIAEEEAFEEAGVTGKVKKPGKRFPFASNKADEILVYPMRVKEVLDDWPERKERKRRIVSLKAAKKLLEKDLRKAMKKVYKQLD